MLYQLSYASPSRTLPAAKRWRIRTGVWDSESEDNTQPKARATQRPTPVPGAAAQGRGQEGAQRPESAANSSAATARQDYNTRRML